MNDRGRCSLVRPVEGGAWVRFKWWRSKGIDASRFGRYAAFLVCLVAVVASLFLLAPATRAAGNHPDLAGEELSNERCLGCHEEVAAELPSGQHAAVEQGCTACHDVIKAKDSPYLVGTLKDVCGACHELAEKEIVAKHGAQPFADVACTGCHAPHASKNKSLLLAYSHTPFTEGQCDACHDTPEGGKIKLVTTDAKELCTACHEDLEKKFASAKVVHAPIESDGCVLCHSPHATRNPAHLRDPAATLCASCHEDIFAQLSRTSSHAAAKDPGCMACHDPHASNVAARLRADPNTVCLGCHFAALPPGGTVPPSVEIVPGYSVRGSLLQKTKQINLDKRGLGHPIFNHPVGGHPDPLRKGQQLGCLSCHFPHGGNSQKLLIFELAPGQGICQKCHQM